MCSKKTMYNAPWFERPKEMESVYNSIYKKPT
jgi:hypothetical protein